MGVLGQNDATSGTPIGVQGAVPNNPGGYGLATPDNPEVGRALHTYQRLLKNYPGSLRAAGARERIRALQRAAKDATSPAS